MRLGFSSPGKQLMGTPSKPGGRESITSPEFEFSFASGSNLSVEARRLMANIREEATRIKSQMQAEKNTQESKQDKVENSSRDVGMSGRKLATPRGKAGRFSDVHMAQFRKMDSIANHPSSFRARPGFAQPQQQSLKRSSQKAGLDEPERPPATSRGTPKRAAPPSLRPRGSASSLKVANPSPGGTESPAKRMRHLPAEDVLSGNYPNRPQNPSTAATSLPRPISSSLLSPTKASLARGAMVKMQCAGSDNSSVLPRSSSVKSLKAAFEAARPVKMQATRTEGVPPGSSPSKSHPGESAALMRPLPPVPGTSTVEHMPPTIKNPPATSKSGKLSSKLPTLAGLKSILRPSTRKPSSPERPGTPKLQTKPGTTPFSSKKVDFTPSVKSRYAVKLAASSPSPARHVTPSAMLESHDLADLTSSDVDDEGEWEDAESEIEYPMLPPQPINQGPVVRTFSEKAKEHNRRESKEFKSIFTTLHHPSRDVQPATSTSVNTTMSRAGLAPRFNPASKSPNHLHSPNPVSSTIRRVRPSDTVVMEPFEESIQTVPHGLTAKKRRRDSAIEDDRIAPDDDAKENRRVTLMSRIPGGWEESSIEEDEGEKRGGKRIRVTQSVEPLSPTKAEVKKPNTARELAAKSAKEKRKGGILTMARLNMLSKPKSRN